jgi:hypothetical protein
MFTVFRLCASSVMLFMIGMPPCGRKSSVTWNSAAFGLASRMNVSKNDPVAPSGTNHVFDGAVTPADS